MGLSTRRRQAVRRARTYRSIETFYCVYSFGSLWLTLTDVRERLGQDPFLNKYSTMRKI